jgi:putative tricarboxylic transport membrane protein
VKRAERAFTWTILAFCAAYALDATTIDMRLGQQVSAAAFPLAAAILAAASCVALLVSSRRRAVGHDRERPADIGRTEVVFTAMGFAYWLSWPWLGYVIATSLFLLLGTASLGERLALRSVAVSVGTAAALWIVFVLLLGVPLPGPPLVLD